MLRSLFTGISGLSVHQTMLDVTSNNIANVNTTGFKSASTRFEDTFSQLVRSGAAAKLNERGGMNPSQVGLGVKLQSITQNFTGGAAQTTGRNLDTMINGDGFFVLQRTNGTSVYTRNGSFGLDSQGQMVAADGSFVQGWMAADDGSITAAGATGNIVLPLSSTMEANPTRNIIYGGNMPADRLYIDPSKDPSSDNAFTITQVLRTYDDKGNPHNIMLEFARADWDPSGTNTDPAGAMPKWELRAYDADAYNTLPKDQRHLLAEDGGARISLTTEEDGDTVEGDAASVIHDDASDGVLVFAFQPNGQLSEADKQALKTLSFKINNVTVDDSTSPMEVTVDEEVTGANTTLDLSSLTGFGGVNSVQYDQIDGNSAGTMTGYSIEADGTIRGTFSNGDTRALAKVATASFVNPLGLEKAGSSYFVESGNSGQPQIGEPGSGPRGAMTGGAIEMSNVDLAAEFTNLILSQRGFQANSRVITTSDEILQELVNMKR